MTVLSLLASIVGAVTVPGTAPVTLAAPAGTYYVSDGEGPAGDCSTTSYTTGDGSDDAAALQAAFDAAATDGTVGAVIHLCAGTFDLSSGITIVAGDDTQVAVVGEGTAETTVRRSQDANPSSRFSLFTASGVGTVYREMTLRGAIAPTGSYSQYKGGAITSNRDVTAATMVFLENTGGVGGAIGARGSIDVFGATFQGNRAAFGGGALFTDTGSVTVVDASFTGNRVPGIYTGTAGAIALYADRPLRILRATFEDNGARQAGAVYAGGTVELSSATFARNQAVEFAGALYANREVAITDGTFVENRVGIGATNPFFPPSAGAVEADCNLPDGVVCELRFERSTFDGNVALGGPYNQGFGGALTAFGTVHLRINASAFIGNFAPGGVPYSSGHYCGGGAINVEQDGGGARIDVSDSTFHGNSATFGAAAVDLCPYASTSPAEVSIVNSTFVENTSATSIGGVRVGVAATGHSSLEIRHSTFWANVGGGAADHVSSNGDLTANASIFAEGRCSSVGSPAGGANLSTDASCFGGTAVLADLALTPLADNGGLTPTVAIAKASVAVDAEFPCSLANDQRGHARPQGTPCDAGAFEVRPPTTTITQARSGGVDLTGGVPGVGQGDSVTDVATVIGASSDGTGGFIDPTSGSVSFYICHDANVAPAECSSGTGWTFIGNDEVDGGGSTGDGLATAAVTFTPSDLAGTGWYLISAVYDASGGTYDGSETTGDTRHELVLVYPPVTVIYNGPWRVNTSSTLPIPVSLAAWVDPAVPGCPVRFQLSGSTYATGGGTSTSFSATTGGVTDAGGRASGYLAAVPMGTYFVKVSISDGSACTGLDTYDDILTILPGSVTKGSSGGGQYRLDQTDGTGNWRRNSFGHVISVTSSYSKRTGLTTTTTSGQLLWYSSAFNSLTDGQGWRIKASFYRPTTDGSSVWQPFACPSGVGTTGSNPICGRFTGTALLQERDADGVWQPSSRGVVTFTVTVYDGGSLTTCARKQCKTSELADYVGITIVGIPKPTASSDRSPQVWTPVKLKTGSIKNT